MEKQKFSIPVIRSGFACRNIEVEATSQEEAENLALDEAGNYEFSEHTSEYEVDRGVKIDYPALIKRIKNQLIHIEKDELTKAESKIIERIKKTAMELELLPQPIAYEHKQEFREVKHAQAKPVKQFSRPQKNHHFKRK